MNKYFYLPGYYHHATLLQKFFSYKQEHEDYFFQDRIIAGVYDLPNGLIWNGGRNNFEVGTPQIYQDVSVKNIINFWHNNNISLLHTCTNLFIDTPELLHDPLCNNFIKKYYLPQDKIIIANKHLKSYLKETYPQISFINSTTLGITDIKEVNKLSKDEYYVVNYNKNIDDEYLKQLKYPEHLEILCGEHCILNCPYRTKHYEIISKAQIENKIPEEENYDQICPFFQQYKSNYLFLPKIIESSTHRVPNNRIEQLSKMGFSHFKISGRSWSPFVWLQLPIYYLVKPIYQEKVYNDISDWYKILQQCGIR